MRADTLIIDGRHALWRTSDAFKNLSTEVNGMPMGTGGMYGFLSLMIRVHQKYGGNTVVAWEGKENFRKELYEGYKKRKELTEEQLAIIEDMGEQELRLKAMLRAMGVEQYYGLKCEADDVIGRLSKENSKNGNFVIIYSGDSDLRQLVTDNVYVASPGYRGSKDTIYDKEKVYERHGVIPDFIPDLKALSGDSSDGIPGLKGIGGKTAVKMINKYGNIENIITSAEIDRKTWPVSERFRDVVLDNVDQLRLFKDLTTIRCDMSMGCISARKSKETLMKHFAVYHFASLSGTSDIYELMNLGS